MSQDTTSKTSRNRLEHLYKESSIQIMPNAVANFSCCSRRASEYDLTRSDFCDLNRSKTRVHSFYKIAFVFLQISLRNKTFVTNFLYFLRFNPN